MIADKPHSLRVLLSAYACEPDKGSEPGVGWHWTLALLRRGCHVCVVTRSNNRRTIEEACREQHLPYGTQLQFIYCDLPQWATWWKRGRRGVHLYYALWQRLALRTVRRAHRVQPFDIVHHLTFGAWRQPSLLYRLRLPFVYGPVGGGEAAPAFLSRTLPLSCRFSEWLRAGANRSSLANPTLRACLKAAALVVARTPETAVWVRRAGARHTIVSPETGVAPPPDWFAPLPSRRRNEPLKCIYAGRLLGWKGIHLAILALAQARSTGCEVALTIVGQGPQRAFLQQHVDRCELHQAVHFVKWLPQTDLFRAYQAHHVLVFPSFHDSGGSVVLEAMAHGLPVLCLGLGGPGVLVDESCGHVVEVHGDDVDTTVEALARAMTEMGSDPLHWARLRDGAMRRAHASSWDAAVSRVYGHLDRILPVNRIDSDGTRSVMSRGSATTVPETM